MNPVDVSNPQSGSRWHFLLAIAVAVVIAIGLTSTAAKAGLIAATELPGSAAMSTGDLDNTAFDMAAAAGMQAAPPSYQPAVIATPALVVTAGTPSDLALHPYLEEEQEFAPRFQHVVERSRAGQNNVMARVGCALFSKRNCGSPIRT
jgi:hypothetical protein